MNILYSSAKECLSNVIQEYKLTLINNGDTSIFLIGTGIAISLTITPYGIEDGYYFMKNKRILHFNNLSLAICAKNRRWLSPSVSSEHTSSFNNFIINCLSKWKKLIKENNYVLEAETAWLDEFQLLTTPKLIVDVQELRQVRENPPKKELQLQPINNEDMQILSPYFSAQGIL